MCVHVLLHHLCVSAQVCVLVCVVYRIIHYACVNTSSSYHELRRLFCNLIMELSGANLIGNVEKFPF